MAPNIPDHYLWFGLGAPFPSTPAPLTSLLNRPPGVFTFLAIQHVSTGLRTVKQLTTVHTPPPKPIGITVPTSQEDAIKTSSLLTLALSHNIDIRNSAARLLCERFYANDVARQRLLFDLDSDKPHVQRRVQFAFRLLREHGVFRTRGLGFGFGRVEPRAQWEHVEVWAGGGGGRARDGVGEGGEEERDARRRRREAVVIHDGEGRIGEADVWMRDREGAMGLDMDMEVGELVIDGVVH